MNFKIATCGYFLFARNLNIIKSFSFFNNFLKKILLIVNNIQKKSPFLANNLPTFSLTANKQQFVLKVVLLVEENFKNSPKIFVVYKIFKFKRKLGGS